MNDMPEPRRRRRNTDADLRDVFGQMVDAVATQVCAGNARAADPVDAPGMLPATGQSRETMSNLPLAPEIATTMHWTDSLIGGLQWLDELPQPNGHVPAQRTRLRKILNLLNHYLGRHPDLQKLGFRDDIATLGIALDALNSGTVHPLLATQAMNKPPDNKIEQQFRAYVVSFVHLLVVAGLTEAAAFKAVAAELTKAGYRASRPSEKNPSTDFRVATVRKWHDLAKPEVEMRMALADPASDRKALLGQYDSHAVFKLIDSFVGNAIHVDGEELPPSKDYVLKVIRATLTHPTTRRLFARRLACA